jgi:hypothetical protein
MSAETDEDSKHLIWLCEQLGDQFAAARCVPHWPTRTVSVRINRLS